MVVEVVVMPSILTKKCVYAGHSSLGSGSNPKVKTHPETIWNLVWLCMVVEKNLFRKNSMGGPSSKFKNLAKK